MLSISDDQTRRLDRARRQYETLLLNAGGVLIDKDQLNSSFGNEAQELSQYASPRRNFDRCTIL
jgi:hypothetical protein